MNINLSTNYPTDPTGQPETLTDQIEEHVAVMRAAGYEVTGTPVLTSEDDDGAYPGSFRVWVPVAGDEWVYIDPEGVEHRRTCPLIFHDLS